ncbi:hypothetical protein NXH64_00665 [Butyrivibrio fibrisolvens]|uniref:hypothetical protein n=1 Tax=Pseudobutyrivibrio ruminis TaxID=46206 RepID=UPI00041B5E0C|nr:hypothetical protein [Pseudobutyrivibrio ruminis]MDC7278003.1 hypothetical protein [Butyrivibrio fibrisolvens]
MGKGFRFFTNLVFALVICFGLCGITVYAEEDDSTAEAAEPQEAEEVEAETVDTVVKNAIQTQIEEAINNLEDPADCYVTVDSGTYDGNITLQGADLSKLGDKTLYILGDGSYQTDEEGELIKTTISAAGNGSATVNGDIYIDGLTVILGGIYLSMGNKITVIDSDTSIYGTTKDDNLTVDAGKDAKIKIDTGEGADTIIINGVSGSSSLDNPFVTNTGSIVIELTGGDGADVYEIDTSVGGDLMLKTLLDHVYESATAITINGDADDRLHLTGSLNKDSVDSVIHGSSDSSVSEEKTYIQKKSSDEFDINLVSEKGLKTQINSIGVGSFTDELENKTEVVFKQGTTPIQNKAFIDYVISLEDTTKTSITVIPSALADNLAHSFSQLKVGKERKAVKVGNITTNGMNLLIVGKEVKVQGNIDTGSGNVVIRANDSDDYNIDLSEMIPMPESISEIVQSAVPNDGKASVFSIKSTASVDVEEGKTIKGNNIDIKSSSKQDQPLVPEADNEALKGINFIAVKVGKAVVNLKGTIQAAGSVIGRAISAITTAASNENLAKWYIPIAAGVLLGEAGISVLGNITARAIKLLSDSTVNLEVASTVGALPVSISVAAIDNDSKVEVKGNAYLKAEQNISMEATGKIKASTVSHAKNKEKKDEKGQKTGADTDDGDGDQAAKNNGANTADGEEVTESGNLYGGFIAVSVAIQNVVAHVIENALVESTKGSINILAEALESVLTSAISYVPETADDAEGEDDKDNGKAASDADTKSDKEGDDTDKRSVENSKDSAASLLTAAGNTKEENQIGDKLDSDDKDKIDNLKKGITGDDKENPSEEGEEPKEDEKKQDGIDKVFDDATQSADPENDSAASVKKSSSQLAGALAVNVLLNTVEAIIETTKSVKAVAGAIRLLADAFTYSKAIANASQVQSAQDEDDANVAVGAAVAINIVDHESLAEIKQGNIEAKELVVSANSGSEGLPVTVHTEAVAGHTDKSEYGIAGAVAIDVASISTKALVGEKAKLVVTDDGLTVKANSNENIKTISTTNEEIGESNARVGVGVAISVDVCGVDTIAQIGSENAQTVINSDIASMAIDAANNLVEEIEATAGATGKVGVSPSVTVVVSGANTESYAYFIPSTEITNMDGDFEQDATNNVERTVSADAKAESQNGGSGALIVTVLNDSAYAKGKSEINANNIRINAVSKSVLTKAHARASSKGAMKNGGKTDGDSDDGDADAGNGDGDQDKQADEAIAGAKSLSKNVGTKNVNENEVDKLTANRQKGQTAEGSVSVAAAFVVNVMSNESIAVFEVPVINAPETAIEVTSSNTTSAYVFADSSSVAAKCDSNGQVESGSSVGVGAAVAINVITIKNEAHIKTNGDIKAKDIRVTATNAIDETYNYDVNTLKTYAVSGAGAGNVGVAGSVAIAVINGNVDAFIDCGNKTIYIVDEIGNIYIRGSIDNNEETIASAALLNGEPDKNDTDKDGNENEAIADSKKAEGNDGNSKSDDGKKIVEVNGENKQNAGGQDNTATNTKPPTDSNNNPKNPNAKAGEEGKSSSVGVGASVALNYSTIETNAYINASKIEANWGVRVFAVENIDRYTFAVAGTDPVAKGASSAMNTVVDASVALLIESDRVNAFISGQPTINAFEVAIEAVHSGEARNQASGFAVGNQSAIGAAVAFIWSDSQAKATFDGVITAAALYINAETRDTDRSLALALAKGTTQEKAKPDSSAQPGTKNNDNKTAEKINTALNKTKSDKAEGEATNSKALSTNLLKTQNVKTESTSTKDSSSETGKAVIEAEGTVNTEVTNKNQSGAGNNNISTDAKGTESKKVDVAAALGILVADHKAETSVAGKIYCSEVTVKAKNDANFSALGTAITMTQLPTTAAVALGVAVAVNKGEAIAKLADGIVIAPKKENEDGFFIIISADVNQNCDNNYFGAQAVSGSIAKAQGNNDTKVAAAGAVAILITDANAQAIVGDNANLKSGDISITAKDDYKLYVRAGSLSYSTKANVGLGISYGMLYANDRISASIGRNAVIECRSLDVEAIKVHEDLLEGQGLKEYIDKAMEVYDGISSNKTVTARGDGSNEEVVIADSDIKSIYTVQEATNIINLFVFDNYHVESFSGSAALGQGDFNGAGAVSFALLKTDVNAVIGENANIKLIKGSLNYGDYSEDEDDYRPKDVYVYASDKADSGLYTIGVAAGNAKNTAGASIVVLIDHSNVKAEIKNGAEIKSENKGGLKIQAETGLNNLIVSVASAVSANASGTSIVGGNVNVFVTDHKTIAQLHDGANVDVYGNIDVNADYANDTILVAAGVQGGKTGTAVAGGTVVVGINKSDTEALVGSENSVNKTLLKSRTGNVNVKANSIDKAVSVLASASVAIGSKAGVAAVIDVLISKAKILAKIISKADITAQYGNINVIASSDTKFTAVDANVALASSGTAAGGTVQVGVFRRIVEAAVAKGCNLIAGGNVLISAYGDDRMLDILAAAAAGSENAIDGVIVVSIEENIIRAILESDKNNASRIDADGSIGISSYLDSDTMLIAAGLNAAKTVAAGGTISTVILNNTIEAVADSYSSLYSGGLKALVIPSVTNGSKDKKKKIRGIAIDSGENSVFRLISAAGSISGKVGVEGVINTVVKSSKVHSYARGHNTLKAKTKEGSIPSDLDVPLDIQVVANTYNNNIDAAGALAVGGTVGVGVSIVTFVNSAEVIAAIIDLSEITSDDGSVKVDAYASENVTLIAVSFAGAGTAAVGVAPNVLVYNNNVKAYITGENKNVYAKKDISVTSTANTDIILNAGGVTASGTAAISLEGNVIYFNNNSSAYIGPFVTVTTKNGDVTIKSSTTETLNENAGGIAGSGTAAVGGSADVVITNINSNAYTSDHVIINSGKNTNIQAIDDYSFIGIAGTIGGSGTAAVIVSAIVAVTHNTIKAQIGELNTINSASDIKVEAKSSRIVDTFGLTVGAAGAAGVSGAVVVIVEGKGIDKDSYDRFHENAGIHPEEIATNGYKYADTRAGETYKVDNLVDEIKSSTEPTRDSAQTIADKGANGGTYQNYANEEGRRVEDAKAQNTSLANATSENLSGKITDASDVNLAYVGQGSVLTAGSNINVVSTENVGALVISGGAGGGTAGVGAGIAVVIITSNVSALVDYNAVLNAGKDIKVEATLTHENVKIDNSSLRFYNSARTYISGSDTVSKANSLEKDTTGSRLSNYGIFIVSGAVAGGEVGVSACVSYFNNSADVRAVVHGIVCSERGNINITSKVDLGNVGVLNVSLSGGAVAVSVSVAISTNEATVKATLDTDSVAQENTANKGSINVKSTTNAHLLTVNGAFAAGGVAVSPLVSISNSRVDSKAYIGGYTRIRSKKLDVKAIVEGDIEAYLGNLNIGIGAVPVTVVIANNKTINKAYVGHYVDNPNNYGYIIADSLDITATVNSSLCVHGYSVATGVYSVNGTVDIADNNAENSAYIERMNTYVTNDINILAGMAGSTKVVVGSVSAGVVGAGAVVAIANINGINKAYVEMGSFELKSKNLRVEAAGLTKDSAYETEAVTTALTGAAGITFAATINFVYATNNAVNEALIDTNGILTATDSIKIIATGKSKALAVGVSGAVGGATGSVVYVEATLSGTNKASLVGKSNAVVTTNSLDILSTSNEVNTKPSDVTISVLGFIRISIEPEAAAEARIYAGDISLGSLSVNKANAESSMTVTANVKFDGEKLQIGNGNGEINIKVNGASTARARSDQANLQFAALGAVMVDANAAGEYKATWNNTAKETVISVKDINIINNYASKANASLTPSAFGVNISFTDAKSNNATAMASSIGKASATGDISNATGNVNIASIGSLVEAYAHIEGVLVTAEFAKIVSNISTAKVEVDNSASLDGRNKNITAKNLTVLAKLNEVNSIAKGGSNSSKLNLTFVETDYTKITAKADVINNAYINDANINATGAVNVIADVEKASDENKSLGNVVHVEATADQPKYSISVASANVVSTETDAVSTVTAKIVGKSNITANQISVTSADGTEVSSKGSAPQAQIETNSVNIKAADICRVKVITQAAQARAREVVSEIGDNVTLTATGNNIAVLALSELDLYTHLNKMSNYSLVKLGNYSYGVEVGKTFVKANIYGKLISNGNVDILAKDNVKLKVDPLEILNVTIFLSTDLLGASTIWSKVESQNVNVILGNGYDSSIEAPNGTITVLAVSSGDVENEIINTNKGLGNKCKLHIRDEYTRYTTVDVKDNTTIFAGYGIAIKADAQNVKISSAANGEARTAVEIYEVWPQIKYNENTNINIGGGCDITAQQGDNYIAAQSESDLSAKAKYHIEKNAYGTNKPFTQIISIVDLRVVIASNSNKRTNIYGKNVTIGAFINLQNHMSEAIAESISVVSDTIASSSVNSNNYLLVNIGNASIIGYDTIFIFTDAKSLEEHSKSYAKIEGFSGKVTAEANVAGSVIGDINIGNNAYKAVIMGPEIVINNGLDDTKINIKRDVEAYGDTIVEEITTWVDETVNEIEEETKDWPWPFNKLVEYLVVRPVRWINEKTQKITHSEVTKEAKGNYEINGKVNVNLDLYCSEYAAGVNILIDEDGNVIATGLKNPGNYVSVDKDAITVHDIKRTRGGKFTLKAPNCNASGTITYYNSVYIPSLNIDNYSDLPLYIRNISMVSDVARDDSDAFVTVVTMPRGINIVNASLEPTRVEIISHGNGDVIFPTGKGGNGRSSYDDFDAGEGSIYIKMNGGNVYTQGNAFVVANTFKVEGAGAIGRCNNVGVLDSSNPFNLYLNTVAFINNSYVKRDVDVASVSLDAKDSINIMITPVVQVFEKVNEILSSVRNFIIRSLKANNVLLQIANQYYTTMIVPSNGTGKGKNSIREFLSNGANYNAYFWLDTVEADTLQVDVPAPRGSSTYTIYVDPEGYKVNNLILNLGNRVEWKFYSSYDVDLFGDGWIIQRIYDRNTRDYIETLELNVEKEKEEKLPVLKHLRRTQRNNTDANIKNEPTPLGFLGITSIAGILSKLKNVVDFSLVVNISGLDAVLVANDCSVNSMQRVILDLYTGCVNLVRKPNDYSNALKKCLELFENIKKVGGEYYEAAKDKLNEVVDKLFEGGNLYFFDKIFKKFINDNL